MKNSCLVHRMVVEIGVTSDPERVGFYSGLVVRIAVKGRVEL